MVAPSKQNPNPAPREASPAPDPARAPSLLIAESIERTYACIEVQAKDPRSERIEFYADIYADYFFVNFPVDPRRAPSILRDLVAAFDLYRKNAEVEVLSAASHKEKQRGMRVVVCAGPPGEELKASPPESPGDSSGAVTLIQEGYALWQPEVIAEEFWADPESYFARRQIAECVSLHLFTPQGDILFPSYPPPPPGVSSAAGTRRTISSGPITAEFTQPVDYPSIAFACHFTAIEALAELFCALHRNSLALETCRYFVKAALKDFAQRHAEKFKLA